MATDLAPELYNQIQTIFNKKYKDAPASLKAIQKRINNGTATIVDANKYATAVGKLMSESLQEVLVADALPERRLAYELAEATLGRSLTDTHNLVSNTTAEIQETMLKAQGIGLKPIQPTVDNYRINGLLKIASEATDFDEVSKSVLGEPVVNFAQNVADESIKENVRFQTEAGLKVMVTRTYDDRGLHGRTEPCQWCLARVGTYEFDEALKRGIFQRHPGCECPITYKPEKGPATRSTGKYTGWSVV